MSPEERKNLEELAKRIEKEKDRLRATYKETIPDGLDLVFMYKQDSTPYVREGVVAEKVEGQYVRGTEFIGDLKRPNTLPALPLIVKGEAWHQGWDIPTRWAIDAKKQCWVDSAHGGALSPVSQKDFLDAIREDDHALRNAHAALGKKPPLPEWMASALSAGWTPPSEFDRSKYE